MAKVKDGRAYNKPPKEHQFRKGVSGNPRGRPRGLISTAVLFAKVMREHHTIPDNTGRERRVPAEELVYRRLFRAAVSGDVQAAKVLIDLLRSG
jgi:hypothetical protein